MGKDGMIPFWMAKKGQEGQNDEMLPFLMAKEGRKGHDSGGMR